MAAGTARQKTARTGEYSSLSLPHQQVLCIWHMVGIDQAIYCDSGCAHAIIGAAALAGSLGGGIHLWVKGRRELDYMLDDYAERYGPKPIAASLTVGPTMNGFGLAYIF